MKINWILQIAIDFAALVLILFLLWKTEQLEETLKETRTYLIETRAALLETMGDEK